MNKIIFCQTPFQVIVSLFIYKQYAKPSDRFDMVVVDTFSGFGQVAGRLQECSIFDHVYVARAKELIYADSVSKKVKKLQYAVQPHKLVRAYLPHIADAYDEMYCWNYDAFTAAFRSYFSIGRQKPIKVYIYDEGSVSYFPIEDVIPKGGCLKLIEMRDRLCGMPELARENVDGYFLFAPDSVLFTPKAPVYPIDKGLKRDKGFVEIVDALFQASQEAGKYDRKYIIFEEAMMANQPEVDDEGLFDKIVQKVGKENVIVKLHPRTDRDRFSKKGIKTIGASGVPWEAVALCGDFTDKVLIAISSSAITSYKILFGDDISAYLLFRFVRPHMPQFDSRYNAFWEKMAASDGAKGIQIPESEEKFFESIGM